MGKENFTALLGAGTQYQGQLDFHGTVRIDGKFSGVINSDGQLILGKEAQVEGTIKVNMLVVHGTLCGEVEVTGRTVLHQTARIFATLATPLLTMEEGAVLQGTLHMGKEDVPGRDKKNLLPGAEKDKAVRFPEAVIEQ